jgi:polysaccharide export outer membrane protein
MKNYLLPFLAICLIFTSCVSYKEITEQSVYFKSVTDSLLSASSPTYQSEIQKGDILYIGVHTANEASARLYNQQNFYAGSSNPSGNANMVDNPALGYLVDENGEINFPFIGKMVVAGMSKTALTDTLTARIRRDVADAVVTIRVMNYKITVLGEVNAPGSYTIPSERVSVLDVIGLAGDLTIFGRRDNVKVIREFNGKREMGVLNLNDGNIFNSPYFYLRQNDIVYVEMNNRKVVNADQTNFRTLSLVTGALSAISLIITLATRF